MRLNRGRRFVVRFLQMEDKREDESNWAYILRHWADIGFGVSVLLLAPWVIYAISIFIFEHWRIGLGAVVLGAEWLKEFWTYIGLEGHLFVMGLFFLWILDRGLNRCFEGIHWRLSVIEDLLRGRRNDF